MIPKFKTSKVMGQWQTDAETCTKIADYKRTCRNGEYYFILFPKIKWNTDQMRKYFHGPVLKFILGELRKKPYFTTKDQLKDDFKKMFGPKTEKRDLKGDYIPLSTAEYSADEYQDLIKRIDEWCMEKLNTRVPTIEEVAAETLKELNALPEAKE